MSVADDLIRERDDLGDHVGSRIKLGKTELLGGAFASAIRILLEQRGVLVFPEVDFTPEEQIAFTRTLGEYVSDLPDGGATPITIDPGAGRSSRYTQSSFFWHFDGYMNDAPILASLLCCERPSPSGGDTEFCSGWC